MPPGDDDERAREWQAAADAAEDTVADGVPIPVDADKTPTLEASGRLRMTPAAFASAVDLADRDAYVRGLSHGRATAIADAQAAAVTELRRVQEDAIDVFRQLFLIFEIGFPAGQLPDWETGEDWIRSRLGPL
ncbi:MAG: hypothetical protein V4537_14300 [Pseudomonadota bacterium]